MALWTLYVLLLPCVCGAIFSTQFETTLNSYIETSMKCHRVPGMTSAVVKSKQITLSHKNVSFHPCPLINMDGFHTLFINEGSSICNINVSIF